MERRMDELGRVVVPMEIRKALGWAQGTRLKMDVTGDAVTLKKSESYCALCGTSLDIKDVKSVRVCDQYLVDIKQGEFFNVD